MLKAIRYPARLSWKAIQVFSCRSSFRARFRYSARRASSTKRLRSHGASSTSSVSQSLQSSMGKLLGLQKDFILGRFGHGSSLQSSLNADDRTQVPRVLLLWAVVRLRLVRPSRSQPAEHDAQIVCGHLGDCRHRESDGLRDRRDRLEVSQTPGRVAIAKASVERLVARGRGESFAFVWTIEIERRRTVEGSRPRP